MKRKSSKSVILAALLILAVSALPVQAATLDLGSVEGSSGGSVTLPVTLSGGNGIAATSVDISYDAAVLANPRAEIGKAAKSADKEIHSNTPSKGVFRVGVLGVNLNEIPDGQVATVTFDVLSSAPSGKIIVLSNSPSASDTKGNALTMSGSNGEVKIK